MVFGQVALPIELIYGKPTTDTEISDSCKEYAYQLQQTLDKIHEFARKHLQMSSDNMKRRCDRQAHQLNLEISGTVWLYNPKRTRGVCKQNERVLIQYLKS